jgi:hypothetical protein
MKTIFLSALLLFTTVSETAHARVEARFLSFIGMISITDRVMGRVTDDDPQRLHAAMNVEEQEKGGKRAKVIQLEGKKFSLLCSDQGGGAVVCTMVVKAGAQGTVSPGQGLIRFVSLGQEAKSLHGKFFPNQENGRMEYLSEDGGLRISSDGETFLAEYRRT